MMVNLSALSIVFCLFLGSINSYFVTALQGDTSVYSCKSTFDATGGEANVLPDVCLVAVLALFPFLQIASIISVSSFNETAHVWLLLRCVLRARPQLKKTGWVPGIWQAFVGEALWSGWSTPCSSFASAAYVALSTTFDFYSVATAGLVGRFILEIDSRALELVEAYRFGDGQMEVARALCSTCSEGTPSLAASAVVYVGKDAALACKRVMKRLVLGLSEFAILVAAKSVLTAKLLLVVPVMGSLSMRVYQYPSYRSTPIGRRSHLYWVVTAFGVITYAGLVVLHQYVELSGGD